MELTGTGSVHPVPSGNWKSALLDVTSPRKITELVERDRPNAVIYAAYQPGNRAVTVDGALNAAGAAAKAGARFLFISSDMVFDGAAGNYDELARAMPVLPYGTHKLEAEAHVWIEHEEAIILRPALMVGESFRFQRPAYECDLLARGRPCALYVDEWRSPVFVDDVVRAAWDLVSLDVHGIYHLGGPERMTRLQLGRLLCAGYRFDPALITEARRPAERPKDLSLKSARLAELLGWAARPIGQALQPAAAAA